MGGLVEFRLSHLLDPEHTGILFARARRAAPHCGRNRQMCPDVYDAAHPYCPRGASAQAEAALKASYAELKKGQCRRP